MTKKKITQITACFCVVIITISLIFFYCTRKNKVGLTDYYIKATFEEKSHTITAHETINWFNNTNNKLSSLKIHLYGVAFSENVKNKPIYKSDENSAYPNGLSYGNMSVSNVKIANKDAKVNYEGEDKDILSIKYKINKNSYVKIDLDFELKLANVNARLGYNDKTINLGNWFPIVAGYDNGFVCNPYYNIGDPFFSEIANYNIEFTVSSDFIFSSSGQSTSTTKDKNTIYNVKANSVRDFAIVLSKEFKIVNDKVNNTNIKYYYYDDNDPKNALKAAVDAVKTFNDKFCEYPYSDLSIVQTHFVHGGMEYPNIVLISDKYTGEKYNEIIIHEIAHQWWYGLVGNDQTHDAWIDEGLAEFSTALFYDFNPSYGETYDNKMLSAVQNYRLYFDLQSQGTKIDTSMNRNSNEFKNPTEYAYINYLKGELMFDYFKRTLGDNNFFNALKYYANTYKYKIVKKEDIIKSLEKTCKLPLTKLVDGWVLGTIAI